VTYASPEALRSALEQRLRNTSSETGVGLDRLRRRVLLERILARLQRDEPGVWVLKGGMALEVRLRDDARLTRDLDLGLRADVPDAESLHDRLIDALSVDADGDGFEFIPASPRRLRDDAVGEPTWRVSVDARLAGRTFGRIQLDVSPRHRELDATDVITLPNSLRFAGVPAPTMEVVDVHRHAAEKLHAMLRDFGDLENSRVRDLVDIVILVEHGLVVPATLAPMVELVWAERDGKAPPRAFPSLPESWPARYERTIADVAVHAGTYAAAVTLVDRLWDEMFAT
jgi:predicted nucleotidyltransferase component of viral defense system